jgi:hypothetical protein
MNCPHCQSEQLHEGRVSCHNCGKPYVTPTPINMKPTKNTNLWMQGIIILISSAAVFYFVFNAGDKPQSTGISKTYSPAQLTEMVKNGKFPDQKALVTESKNMDYTQCILEVEGIVGAIKNSYPTITVASTNILRMEKIWTNDSAMTITCSAPDRKMIITSATYK